MSIEEEYIVVTTVSTFRQKYCVPKNRLQLENTSVPVDPKWALDAVTCEDVSEFSQKWLGESIVDMHMYDTNGILDLFDEENDYLAEWSVEQKLEFINKWKTEQR
tara:strand:- start:6786 stop:7100 length:315 start_codon:yes stop_codon:yes gene_type:complete